MVTSLFEAAGPAARIPVELIAPAGRGVALLEFLADGEARAGAAAGEARDERAEAAEGTVDQVRTMVDAAREEAKSEAWAEFEDALERRLAAERGRVEEIRTEFARDRERYFAAAETQVVRLALAVARRVLQREVEADAMLLRGTVRAALARVKEGSGTVLKVREEEVESWRGLLGEEVMVAAERGMTSGECRLETNVGRVELGVEAQMAEVERGFVELMQRQEQA